MPSDCFAQLGKMLKWFTGAWEAPNFLYGSREWSSSRAFGGKYVGGYQPVGMSLVHRGAFFVSP